MKKKMGNYERKKRMKKSNSVCIYVLLMVALLLPGCGRHAAPIVLPAVNDIDSIRITTFDETEVSFSDKEWIEQFITVVLEAKSTTKASIQDVPNAETYGEVDISNNSGVTTLFYYVEKGKCYIEQPYQGIYQTDTDIDSWAKEAENMLSEISKTIGVDVSAGEVISESDTHEGFHGDGDRVIEIQFTDTFFSDQLKDNAEWKAMPLTENLTALVYGLHTETSSIGPMIHSEDNVPVVPEIENGYYYFRDRHSQSTDPKDDTNILSRASYNFTIAIFDADANILYYSELDT